METLLITGASRGIGLELTRQALEQGKRVFAGCRQANDKLRTLQRTHPKLLHLLIDLDVTSTESRENSLTRIAAEVDHLDLLIHNAGIMPRHEQPGNLDAQVLLDTFQVNSIAPILLAQECLPLLERSERPRVLNVSSQLGSLHNKETGGYYSYCASKAALKSYGWKLCMSPEMKVAYPESDKPSSIHPHDEEIRRGQEYRSSVPPS